MFFITSLFNLPFLILIWLIEAYIFLAATRFILARGISTRQSHFYQQVKLLTDPVPNVVGKVISRHKNATAPSWLSWFVVIVAACITRQLLLMMVLA